MAVDKNEIDWGVVDSVEATQGVRWDEADDQSIDWSSADTVDWGDLDNSESTSQSDAAAAGAWQGATFEFGDEIEGFIGAVTGDGYQETRDEARKRNKWVRFGSKELKTGRG